MGILVADAAEACHLVVPEFTAALSDLVAGIVHETSGTTNPIDAGADVAPERMADALDAVLSSGEVDAVVTVVVATGVTDGVQIVRRLEEVRTRHPEIPVVLVPLGGLDVGHPAGLTTYGSPASAVRAIGHAVSYVKWQAVPAAPLPVPDPAQSSAARQWCRSELHDAHTEGRWLAAWEARHLLGPYGLRLLGSLRTGADGAAEEAERIGFPVAIKAADAGGAHKSERRLVRTGLTSAAAVRLAVSGFEVDLGRAPAEVLVQPMESGVEMALGVVRDPTMGPLVMVAAGGVATDLWADRAFLLPPISLADAQHAVRGLRTWPLLNGYRGGRAVDVADLERLVVDLGRLAVEVPEIAELDLNPVIVSASTCSIVDVRLRLASTDDPGAGTPRQLRRID
jgi:acyl-CoA synthetase (NDP forming)